MSALSDYVRRRVLATADFPDKLCVVDRRNAARKHLTASKYQLTSGGRAPSVVGVGTVLRLEQDAWSMAERLST